MTALLPLSIAEIHNIRSYNAEQSSGTPHAIPVHRFHAGVLSFNTGICLDCGQRRQNDAHGDGLIAYRSYGDICFAGDEPRVDVNLAGPWMRNEAIMEIHVYRLPRDMGLSSWEVQVHYTDGYNANH